MERDAVQQGVLVYRPGVRGAAASRFPVALAAATRFRPAVATRERDQLDAGFDLDLRRADAGTGCRP